MNPRGLIVAGTDTGVGKTVIAAALTMQLGARYWKPVQAGLEGESDSQAVARLSGLGMAAVLPEAYRLTSACSPHQAATIDGLTIAAERLALPGLAAPLVVEAAGGVLTPLAEELLFADQFARWGLPVVLVVSTRLGAINHSLLSIEALRARRVAIAGAAFTGEEQAETERFVCAAGKVRRLGRLPHLDPLDAASLGAAFAEGFVL